MIASGRFPWASVTKLATAVAMLVAAEEGIVDLDEPAGPPGSTFRHLLAHASGLPFDHGAPIARPGRAAHLLELRLRGRGRAGRGAGRRCRSPTTSRTSGRTRPAVLSRLGRLGRRGDARRPARARARAAGADAHRAGDAGRRRARCSSPGSSAWCRASVGRSRTTGGSASSCATRSRRTGRARATRRGRSGTSAAAARSSGSTRTRTSRSRASPTSRSATGRPTRGRACPTQSCRKLEQ